MYSQIDSNRRKTWLLILLVTGLLSAVGWTYGYIISDTGPAAIILALVISLGMTLISWFAGDKVALATTGAVELTDRNQFMTLWNTVENLAITAGIPRPRIYIVTDDAPNAFATGRDPEHASIAVTTGLLSRVEKSELEGVLAHEMSHIKNLDIRVMMIVIVLVGAVAIIGNWFLRSGLRRSSRSKDAGPIPMLIGLAFLILAPLVGELIKLAISRRREYLADASAALLTRYPEGLARALEKIREANLPMQRASTATNHLWISSASAGKGVGSRLQSFFSTHPPIDDRIAKLRGMLANP